MPAMRPAQGRARGAPAARTRNTSAQIDRPAAAAGRRRVDIRRSGPPRRPRRSSRGAHARDCGQRRAELQGQSGERLGQRRRPSHDHDGRPRRRGVPGCPVGLAQSTPRAISLYRISDLSAHCEPCARRPDRLAPQHDERRPVNASASLEKRLKIGAGGQPLASGKATR
jgi:hypothetical protein